MIHYHGTPLGGPTRDKGPALSGRHAFVPYSHPDDAMIVQEFCQSFALDNGAFSVWKRGGELDVDGYINWCYRWYRHPGFDWAVIPDVIDGSEEENDTMLKCWPADIRGVPVWHMHESIERLCLLADSYPIVALGSSGAWPTPGTKDWWRRMGDALDAICDDAGFPICRLHGLRMLNPDVFSKMPLSSADSVNAGRNNNHPIWNNAAYTPATAAARTIVIMDRIESHNSAPIWTSNHQPTIMESLP